MHRLAALSAHLCPQPGLRRLLVANRGEIALRVMRAATELEIETVAIFTRLDADALHTRSAGASVEVPSYLDTAAIVKAALDNDCDALHPGYGFLSESADLARSCEQAGLRFVGPTPATIALLGDKLAARRLAQHAGVPVANGSDQPCADAASVRAAMTDLGLDWPVILKAVGGGGGRGVRPVHSDAQLETAFGACVREAAAVGAQGGVFVEELLREARHIEVQLLGDAHGGLVHLHERDCSVQRRRQKLIEVAPALGISDAERAEMLRHALALGSACGYRSAGTVEFLLPKGRGPIFIEVNPRIQVEHTVTEEATGVDLVASQLRIAAGASLAQLGLARQQDVVLTHCAIQARVAMSVPGRVTSYAAPGGPGVRVDGCVFAGYLPPPSFDPLLLKVVARCPLLTSTHLARGGGGDGGGGGGSGGDDGGGGGGGGGGGSGDGGGGSSGTQGSAQGSAEGESAGAAFYGAFDGARRRLLRACSELHIGGTLGTNLAELQRVLAAAPFVDAEWTVAMLDDERDVRCLPPPAMEGAAGEGVGEEVGGKDVGGSGERGERADLGASEPPHSDSIARSSPQSPALPARPVVVYSVVTHHMIRRHSHQFHRRHLIFVIVVRIFVSSSLGRFSPRLLRALHL